MTDLAALAAILLLLAIMREDPPRSPPPPPLLTPPPFKFVPPPRYCWADRGRKSWETGLDYSGQFAKLQAFHASSKGLHGWK